MKLNTVQSDVRSCARCGLNHANLTFQRLAHPVDGIMPLTHWSACPTNGQPILLAVVDDDAEPEPPARIVDDHLVLDERGAEMLWTGIIWADREGQCVCDDTPEGHQAQKALEATLGEFRKLYQGDEA